MAIKKDDLKKAKSKTDKELKKAKDEIEKSLKKVEGYMNVDKSNWGEDAKEKVEELRKKAEAEIKKMKREVNKAMENAESYVKKNPKKATAISASVGLMIGALGTALMKAGRKKKK